MAFLLFIVLLLGEGGLGVLAGSMTLAASAAMGVVLLVVASALVAWAVWPIPPARIRTAFRDRERRTAFLPQRDPDAAGRSRPRAPGRLAQTAA
ncbi:DUF6412 domain-containing protein [Streptomyces sp. NPDC006879]|uniref:DUF6412 domain-containing protein n=1 Tax=Streptomyces sp. NPDC006879 TaxID=3364767 RepID=UPI00369E31D4